MVLFIFSIEDLEKIYGEPFKKNYATVKPPVSRNEETQSTNGSPIDHQNPLLVTNAAKHKNTFGTRREVYRKANKNHNGMRKKGKVPRSTFIKGKCTCRKRRKVSYV